MNHFLEICTKIKVFAVELATLLGFLAVLGLVLFTELRNVLSWAR